MQWERKSGQWAIDLPNKGNQPPADFLHVRGITGEIFSEIGFFAEQAADDQRRIGQQHVRHRGVVLGHAHVGHREIAVLPHEAVEIRVDERAGDLARAVGAEVEEYGVSVSPVEMPMQVSW